MPDNFPKKITKKTREKVRDPFNYVTKEEWLECYEIAGKVISGEIPDPTKGANHYYDDSINTPTWAKDQRSTLTISYMNQRGEEAKIFFLKL